MQQQLNLQENRVSATSNTSIDLHAAIHSAASSPTPVLFKYKLCIRQGTLFTSFDTKPSKSEERRRDNPVRFNT